MIFISEPYQGTVYIAEPSRRGSRKLLWSSMPITPIEADVRIDANTVPMRIRRQAYRRIYRLSQVP